MNRRLLHLVVDDKFIDAAIREFEAAAPGRHEFVTLDTRPPYRYVKDGRVRNLDGAGFAREAAREDVGAVVVHAMTPQHLAAIQSVPADRGVVWIGWGYDYYGLLNDAFPEGLVQPATAALLARGAGMAGGTPAQGTVPTMLAFARPYRKPTRSELAALARVDWFSPVLDTEYHLARRHQPDFRAHYLRWNYGTVEDDFTLAGLPERPLGPNLLLGNSATATNNHLELFELVRQRVDLAGRRIVVPLSYGDANYRRHVLQAGQQLFGEAFQPLVDFMPREQYIDTLASCGFVLMNHVRQQALGNIYIGALLGARVFLNRRNPLNGWLRAQGLPIADLEQLDGQPLTEAERDRQITALYASMGRAAQRERTLGLVETVLAGRPARA